MKAENSCVLLNLTDRGNLNMKSENLELCAGMKSELFKAQVRNCIIYLPHKFLISKPLGVKGRSQVERQIIITKTRFKADVF